MRANTPSLNHSAGETPLICVDAADSASALRDRGYLSQTISDIVANPGILTAEEDDQLSPLYLMATEHASEHPEFTRAVRETAAAGRRVFVVPHCAIPRSVDGSDIEQVSQWLSNPQTDIEALRARGLALGQSVEGAVKGFIHLSQLPLNDLGLAQRVKARVGHLVRWSQPEKTFYVFGGSKWVRDDRCRVMQYVTAAVTALHEEAAPSRSKDELKALEDAIRKYRSQRQTRAVTDTLKALPGIPVVPTDFDNNPHLFSTGNAAIDLRQDTIRTLRPSDLTTKSGGARYDANATAPKWEQFLSEIMEGDAELVAFLQRYLGYCLSGETSQHVFPVFYGTGRNGKSVFMNVVQRVLGDYALPVPQEAVMSRRRNAGAATPEIAQLKGVRFAVVNETDDGKRLNEGQVKAITGGDKITARPLYSQQITFWPQFKVGVMTNYKPRITGSDNGIWRRVLLIPFNYTVPADEVDPYLEEKLHAEASGILNWMLEGYRAYAHNGLSVPQTVRHATDEYRNEEDIVLEFIEERCTVGVGFTCKRSTLYRAYTIYCRQLDEYPKSKRAFADQIRSLGYEETRTSSERQWSGVKLRKDYDPERKLP